MPQCLSKNEFMYFLETIRAGFEKVGDTLIIIHATAGDVYWFWDGANFCLKTGTLM